MRPLHLISALGAVQIFEPVQEGDRDLLLVFCPGALQASENYFPLVHEIQAQLSLRLWVVVLHNTRQEALSTSKIDVSLTGVIARLKERGFRPGGLAIENVFLAGHRYTDSLHPHAAPPQPFLDA